MNNTIKRIILIAVVTGMTLLSIITICGYGVSFFNQINKDMTGESSGPYGFWLFGIVFTVIECFVIILLEINIVFIVKKLIKGNNSCFQTIIQLLLLLSSIVFIVISLVLDSPIIATYEFDSIRKTCYLFKITSFALWLVLRVINLINNLY